MSLSTFSAVSLPLRKSRIVIAAIMKRVEILELLLTGSLIESLDGCINISVELGQNSQALLQESFTAPRTLDGSMYCELGRYGAAEKV
jgi:hypothetical protein